MTRTASSLRILGTLWLAVAAAAGEPARDQDLAEGWKAFPGEDWAKARPESQGVDPTKLQQAMDDLADRLGEYGGIATVFIVRNGCAIWEGTESDREYPIFSATKSFTGTVLGLLIDDGKASLETLAKDLEPTLSERYSAVTLRHFATMTSGYDSAGGSYEFDGQGRGDSWNPGPPAPPMFSPGAKFRYWDEAMMQFGHVLTKAAGQPLDRLLKARIADPIGMNRWRWTETSSPTGRVLAWTGGINTSSRELARLGHLFLNRGNWGGRQLVGASWVDQATSVQVPASIPNAELPRSRGAGVYGFNWWVNGVKPDGKRLWPDAPPRTYYANGLHNNVCIVVPEWRLVIARTNGARKDGSANTPANVDETWNRFFQRLAAAVGAPLWDDAVAVWHMADPWDSAGKDSRLTAYGGAKLGVELTGADREASFHRGGGGLAADLQGGYLDAGQGADAELNLRGRAMSLCVRLQNPDGDWQGHGILSKYGGHERLVYNLYANEGELGFELGTDTGLHRVTVPAAAIGPTGWHDVVVRYGRGLLELFVDGALRGYTRATGPLREGNTEPTLIGAYSLDGRVHGPAPCRIDTAAVWSRALTDEEVAFVSGLARVDRPVLPDERQEVSRYREVIRSKSIAEYGQAARALRKFMRENDPHMPLYHFTAPESWMNDPNGVVFHGGRYYLFYQYNPIVDGAKSATVWGHAVSSDLVHWEDWPIALWPDSPHDKGGCYSGNIAIDDRGIPNALYTGNVRGHEETYGMRAWSLDGFLTWQKRMVMHDRQRPSRESPVHWDGQVWKEGSTWFQLIGGTLNGRGAAHLWTSPDLERWTYRKPIYSGAPGTFWELPYLIRFGPRAALLIGMAGNPYWIGTYYPESMEFRPDDPERPRYADYGAYYSFNPNLWDDKGPGGAPRRIVQGWVTGEASPSRNVPYWQGAHSIPRVAIVEGDRLVQSPVPELRALRGRHRRWEGIVVRPDGKDMLPEVRGDALEILATFELAGARATRLGLKARVSDDGDKFTPAWFEVAANRFGAGENGGPLDRPAGPDITLQVFVDRSILEVYADGNACTARMFPDAKSQRLDLFAEGGEVRVRSVDVWEMGTMWEP